MNKTTQYELESNWISAEGMPGVNCRYGDIVRIKTGEHAGETGEVIALLSIEPAPTYGVVLPPDEKFVVVFQNDVETTGLNSGGTLTLVKPYEQPRTSTPQ
jgi:hypothetical protein